jgi:hypothetical protein
METNHYFDEKIISTELSLIIIVAIIASSVILSLAKPQKAG